MPVKLSVENTVTTDLQIATLFGFTPLKKVNLQQPELASTVVGEWVYCYYRGDFFLFHSKSMIPLFHGLYITNV